MRHVIEPDLPHLNDAFSRDHKPVWRVDRGDELVVRTLDYMGNLERRRLPGDGTPIAKDGLRGHCLVGPIAINGAKAGQTLVLQLRSLRPSDWAFTIASGWESPINHRLDVVHDDKKWLVWDLDHAAGTGHTDLGVTVSLAPFLGVMGVAPSEPGEHSTIPPRTIGGGNIDCKELVAGTTLYLPIAVDDALLYLGDGHAAQGDGEVGGTALETGMTTELVVAVIDDPPVAAIHAVTPTSRITFGFDADLNVATGDALDAMIAWMQKIYGVGKPTALALASASVDLRITQVVNQTWGVHAVLDHDRLVMDRR